MDMALKSVDTKTLENGITLIVVEQELTLDDGQTVRGRHVFPDDALEWRAAEYDIDPGDMDTLLDMVLWEPHLPDPDRPDLMLHDAPDIDSAREYHLSRIQAMKDRSNKAQVQGKPDPIREQIKGLARINSQAIELKRRMVGSSRAARARQRAILAQMTVGPVSEEERVERLKAIMARPQGHGGNNG